MKKSAINVVQLIALALVYVTAYFLLCYLENKNSGKPKNDYPDIRAILDSDIADSANITVGKIYLQYNSDLAVVWYIIEDSDNKKQYLPVLSKYINSDEYQFIEKCNCCDTEIEDVVYTYCLDKYIVFINNKDCTGYKLIGDDNNNHIVNIEKDSYPYITYVDDISVLRLIVNDYE